MRRFLLLVALIACPDKPPDTPIDEPEDPLRALIIDEPAPGGWTGVGPVQVRGRFENLVDIRVDGATAGVNGDRFEASTDLVRGMNLIHATGVSPGGVEYATHIGLIAGDTANPDEPVDDAARVRLNQPGLDLAMTVAAGLLDPDAIEALLMASNPVYSTAGDPEITVDATSFALGDTALSVEAQPGKARLTATLTDLSIGADVDARSGRLTAELSQTLSADRVVITGDLAAVVVDGVFQTTLSDVDVVLTGFSVDTSEWPSWLTGSLTDLILTEVVEGVVRGILPDLLPPVIDEQLNSLDLSFETTVLERPARMKAVLTDAAFDDDGLAIDVQLDVDIDGLQPRQAPGYLRVERAPVQADRTADLGVGLVDDVLNLAAFEAWRAGLIAYTVTTEDGSLPPYVLDALGGARIGTITVSADLPPTIVEHEGTLRAQLGELRVRVDTIGGRNGEYLILAVGGHIDLVLSVTDGVLQAGFGDKSLVLTARETDWEGSLAEVTEVVEELLPLEVALALLSDLEIPLPSIGGLKVQGATVNRGSGGTHTMVAVDLEPIEQ